MKKHRLHFFALVALLIALAFIVSSVGAAPKDGPTVSLSAAQPEFRADQEVVVDVTITNPTRHSVRILKWFTPVDGLEAPLFSVKLDGEPVAYYGAIYKRPAPTGADYLTLKSGDSITYPVNLGQYYDLSANGRYEISFLVASYHLYDEKGNSFKGAEVLASETVSLKVEGRQSKVKPTPPPPPPPGGTTFNACTTAQQATLLDARAQAKTYAAQAENYLLGINSGTSRYTEWFGLFTSDRYNTVRTHFTKISDAWDNAAVTFDCKCKQNAYAYVYPSQPYNIYLCKVFWTAPLAGTDSQGGTLIHEMSHFYVVASTLDYVYGQTGARALADSNPDQAIMNADNHEYFAENNPYLP